MTRTLLVVACALLACTAATALASTHHHHHHRDATPAAAAPASSPRSLSQQHPYARPHDTADAELLKKVKQPPAPNAEALRGSRPNLVYIMADDSGYGDIGANGFGADTPFLDQLASQSLRFTDFHSGASVCTSSRANLMTGRLGLRTGVTDLFWPVSMYGLPQEEHTIAELLVKANYSTAIVGKWHLGHTDGYHPSYRGFESGQTAIQSGQTFGLPWSVSDGCYNVPTWDIGPPNLCPYDPVDKASFAEKLFSPSKGNVGRSPWGVAPANLLYDVPAPNCESAAGADFGGEEEVARVGATDVFPPYPTPTVTVQCNQWILEQPVNYTDLSNKYMLKSDAMIKGWAAGQRSATARGEEPKPFFMYVPLSHMHTPLFFDPKWSNTSRQQTIYGDTLRELDFQVRSLYESLDSQGLLNNTIIIYSSDNGPWEAMCEYGGNPGPFTGKWQKSAAGGGGGSTSKLTTWEAGHRVPALAHWAGKITPGVSAAMGSHLDILPTFLALAGVPLPADRHFDGLDLSPVLFDGQTTLHETLFHAESIGGELSAMRYHQYKAYWKTYAVPACNSSLANTGLEEDLAALRAQADPNNGEINVQLHNPPLIFDVSADPAESTPLTNVDPNLLATIDKLHAALLADIKGSYRSAANWTMGWEAVYPCWSVRESAASQYAEAQAAL